MQAAPPRAIRHVRPARPKAPASVPLSSVPQRLTYVAAPHTAVDAGPARKPLATHRATVIRKLAPTAPLARATRLLAAAGASRPLAQQPRTSRAKTIAALAAALSKK